MPRGRVTKMLTEANRIRPYRGSDFPPPPPLMRRIADGTPEELERESNRIRMNQVLEQIRTIDQLSDFEQSLTPKSELPANINPKIIFLNKKKVTISVFVNQT